MATEERATSSEGMEVVEQSHEVTSSFSLSNLHPCISNSGCPWLGFKFFSVEGIVAQCKHWSDWKPVGSKYMENAYRDTDYNATFVSAYLQS